MLKRIIAICTCARSLPSWKLQTDAAFFTKLLPSISRTITQTEKERWDIRLFVGIDSDDALFLKWLSNATTWPPITLTSTPRQRNRIPFNANALTAMNHNAEYFVRVNDDTEFLTGGWLTMGVKALRDMNNVGVVGPVCNEGNTDILTHDMTHRTHMYIFNNNYYTLEFSAWWIDDWITMVYSPERMRVIRNWTVKHHVDLHGTRYQVKFHENKLLESAIRRGKVKIKNYMQTVL